MPKVISKIQTDSTTNLIGSTLYATCNTAASTAAKVATLSTGSASDFTNSELTEGLTIRVLFTNENTSVDNPTLQIGTSTAKPIFWSKYADTNNTYTPTSSSSFYVDATAFTPNITMSTPINTSQFLCDSNGYLGGIYVYKGDMVTLASLPTSISTLSSSNFFIIRHSVLTWDSGMLLTFTYNGSEWVLNNDVNVDTFGRGVQLASVNGQAIYCPTYSATYTNNLPYGYWTLYEFIGDANVAIAYFTINTFATTTQVTIQGTTYAKDKGLVPPALSTDSTKFLKGDGTWANPVSVVQTLTSGTAIGSVNGTTLYAPSGGGGGASLSFANGTVTTVTANTSYTYATAQGQRSYGTIVVDGTASTISIGITINDGDEFENYLLLGNTSSSQDVTVTLSSITYGSHALTTTDTIIKPDTITIPKGSYTEVSFLVRQFDPNNTVYTAIITASAALTTA